MLTNAPSDPRPDIAQISTGAELKRWYWRKDELIARGLGLKTTSRKYVILERIAHFLDIGETTHPDDQARPKRSTFDWHAEPLSPSTIITDSYKNTQNVRRFFKEILGEDFKFNIAFMEWMTANQFNQFTRDFLDDNPTLGIADARRIWVRKILLPSNTGRHVYDPGDLDL